LGGLAVRLRGTGRSGQGVGLGGVCGGGVFLGGVLFVGRLWVGGPCLRATGLRLACGASLGLVVGLLGWLGCWRLEAAAPSRLFPAGRVCAGACRLRLQHGARLPPPCPPVPAGDSAWGAALLVPSCPVLSGSVSWRLLGAALGAGFVLGPAEPLVPRLGCLLRGVACSGASALLRWCCARLRRVSLAVLLPCNRPHRKKKKKGCWLAPALPRAPAPPCSGGSAATRRCGSAAT